jgi:hypothetical protein
MKWLLWLLCRAGVLVHNPRRVLLGWRCARCGQPASSPGALLGLDDVVPVRREWIC